MTVGTFLDVITRHAAEQGDKFAIRSDEDPITYRDLLRRGRQAAGALAAAGVGKGHRIGWLAPNDPSAIELMLGAEILGATLVPINWRLSPEEVRMILEDARIGVLIAGAVFHPLAERLMATAPGLREIIVIDGCDSHRPSYAGWRDAALPLDAKTAGDSEEIILQIYTSGTTGAPKGVMLSHRAILLPKLLWRSLDWYRWTKDHIALGTMPMFHIGGMTVVLLALEAGGTVVLMPEFAAERVLDLIDTGAVNRLFIVPAALRLLLDHPKASTTHFDSLDLILYGGSPIPPDLLRSCVDRLNCGIAQTYGMTEACGALTSLPPADHWPGSPRLESAGTALPGVELRILDEDDQPCPAGQAGQVAARGPGTMTGYWQRPDATARILSADGWLKTGDIGLLDADGYLFLKDRMNDMIITGGENVYPSEVENVLSIHQAVAEVAIVGVADLRWGQRVHAVAVLRDGATVDAAALTAWCRERLATYKCPRSLSFAGSLPRNASGKVLRRVIREAIEAGRATP